jgi:hypothetical protein
MEFVKLRLPNPPVEDDVHVDVSGYSYLDATIATWIGQHASKGKKYAFEFVDMPVTIVLAAMKNKKLEKYFVYYTCFLVYLFSKVKKLQRIDVTLIGYEGKKKIPKRGVRLTPLHINGGVTMSNGEEAYVVVYRKEEMTKVLTHELIHAFNLDKKDITKHDEEYVNKFFNLATLTCKSVTLNESFTECLATLINTVIYTIITSPAKMFDKAFQRNMKKEQDFILGQAAKVLMHNGFTIREGAIIPPEEPICESTHATSYYVLKAVVLCCGFDEFIKMLNENHMCIDLGQYLNILRIKIPQLAHFIILNVARTKNLKMTCLDIGENYIKLSSN